MSGLDFEDLKSRVHTIISTLEAHYFQDDRCSQILKEHFHVGTLEGLGLADFGTGIIAAGALMQYLTETQKTSLAHLSHIQTYRTGGFMVIDTSTRRNLELVETLREKNKRGSLLWVLDKTRTAMGARMLRSYIEQPLLEKAKIQARHDAIDALNGSYITREELREYLNPIYDLERLISRITYQNANPRDLVAFGSSIQMLPHIKQQLKEFDSGLLKQIHDDLDCLEDLAELITNSIEEEPPLTVREGGIIKDGYHEEVDRLRRAKTEGKNWPGRTGRERKRSHRY